MKLQVTLTLILVLHAAMAAAETPVEAWKKGIAEQDEYYSKVPHAMLKIQDAVYLSDGETATLQGSPQQSASWKWKKKTGPSGDLQISLKNKKLSILRHGKVIDPASIEKGISIVKDIDVAGQPTQVGAGIPGWRIFLY